MKAIEGNRWLPVHTEMKAIVEADEGNRWLTAHTEMKAIDHAQCLTTLVIIGQSTSGNRKYLGAKEGMFQSYSVEDNQESKCESFLCSCNELKLF